MDAHVGERLFSEAILGLKAKGKTVLLVTHALHFLPQTDYIFSLVDGRIHEKGTYDQLMRSGNSFSVLVRDFGSRQENEQVQEDVREASLIEAHHTTAKGRGIAQGTGKIEGFLIKSETRKTGSIKSAGQSPRVH